VPFFDVILGEEEKKAAMEVLESGWLTMGQRTSEFEHEFAAWLGVRHAVAVANGTAALHLAHSLLGLQPGDEVICPSLSFVAGANAILYCGAKPVFADICSDDDLTIAPDSIAERITNRTRAIQVMHYGGHSCDMRAIQELAIRHGLRIIEDCAHAPGTTLDGISLGSYGDIGCFSFFSNKNMTTGEGGMVTTNNDEFAKELKLRRSHGMTVQTMERYRGVSLSYDVVMQGYNHRMDEMRAAIGLAQLKKLAHSNQRRAQVCDAYRSRLCDIKDISLPFDKTRGQSVNHLFPILLKDAERRESLMQYLRSEGIQTSIHYPPIHKFSYFEEHVLRQRIDLPTTERVAERLVTLPLFPTMGEDEISVVTTNIHNYFQQF
jgi:dTDP-4-amino-4,6-dideoxygalactose transaminase